MSIDKVSIDKLRSAIEESRRILSGAHISPIEAFLVSGEEAEEPLGPIMSGWTLEKLDQEGMSLKLDQHNPLEVSSALKPDLLLVQLDLGDFQSAEGVKMPESVVKLIEIPT
eukprot:CAMPEP_0185573960 /NCGR_PEP_ID=MMETSP0434-20130131/5526_1 /TAXON_ID=626734 ORGANISM="Favella taraikaensis, Strain Fe Narragansett Bay" /NCGR_SAMPLE_ID=MMETSP0434 /ASSEMBLY_ACC=CAM_ASM_000379 /LENGTH=111 /DNA_ID=CAMNT_0028190349 /DNA_START=490 /DNA_END=825 /DNA_ORIENTATION=+